jgi:hypothetical protein
MALPPEGRGGGEAYRVPPLLELAERMAAAFARGHCSTCGGVSRHGEEAADLA